MVREELLMDCLVEATHSRVWSLSIPAAVAAGRVSGPIVVHSVCNQQFGLIVQLKRV